MADQQAVDRLLEIKRQAQARFGGDVRVREFLSPPSTYEIEVWRAPKFEREVYPYVPGPDGQIDLSGLGEEP
jgi:hypothetical protein